MEGWVKVYRNVLDKPIWLESTPEQKTVLITLLLMVNHQRKKWEWKGEPYTVNPGEVITSLDSIANKCGKGVSVQNIRTALKRFEKFGFLTNKSTNRNRLITIVNWGIYQSKVLEVTNELTGDQQTTHRQLTSNKKEKKLENVKSSFCRTYDKESVYYKLAIRLFNNIRKNQPSFKEPNFHKWSDDLRKMIEIDNRNVEQTEHLIDWCQQDSFWKSNILSPSKLRKQYDQLVMKAQSNKQTNKNISSQKFSIERPEHWREPNPLTKKEISQMKKMESDLPF